MYRRRFGPDSGKKDPVTSGKNHPVFWGVLFAGKAREKKICDKQGGKEEACKWTHLAKRDAIRWQERSHWEDR